MNISSKIKKIRELKGLSQEYMAENLNISQSAYSKIERSDKSLNIDRLKTISDILEVDAFEFFSKNDEVVFNNNECQKFGYIYNNTIPDKLIETLESQIKEQQSEIAYLRKLLEKELFVLFLKLFQYLHNLLFFFYHQVIIISTVRSFRTLHYNLRSLASSLSHSNISWLFWIQLVLQ